MISLRKHKPISFDELLKELQGQKNNENDQQHVSLDMLFNESFMSKYSSYKSFEEFLAKGNFQATTEEEIRNIPEELLDRHVARETHFPDWKAMFEQANKDHRSSLE